MRPGALSALLQEIAGAPTPSRGVGWESALRPGLAVGKFELVRELGSGGFGVVWEARDKELGRSVAFKAVRAEAKDRLREERLLREAEAAARLSHPNLVTLHDLGHSEHGPYLVLELLRGRTLEERLEQGRLSLREAVRIGTEVARGVAHAHSQGVVHRDLKPGNVFLCDDGQVKVLDFGLAHAFGQRRQDGGTPAYMAPEQWEGAPEDERTDVFALGVMLFEMLSGELPFPEDGGGSVQGPRKAPALEVAELPGLGELVARTLEKRAAQRPRDGGEVASALRSLQVELEQTPTAGGSAVRTRPRAGLPGLVSELRRRKVLPALLGYATFAVVAAKGVDWLHDSGRLPGWGLMAGLALLGLGFPATLFVAWLFDLTWQGFRGAASGRVGVAGSRRVRLTLVLAGLAALAVVPGVGSYVLFRGGEAPSAESRPSIAVLPFADMSPGKDQEYFADGIAEEILNGLAQVQGLRVCGRTSSFSFKGKNEDLRAVGRALGVGVVLEGSVRKAGDRIRITAQLVQVADGFHLWSRSFDRDLADVFAVQDEIARAVVEALRGRLLPGQTTARSGSTTDPEALAQYLIGRDMMRSGSIDHAKRAPAAFQKATALDGNFAMAWAGVAHAIFWLEGMAGEGSRAEARRRGLAAAERAIALAPGLPDGWIARGRLRDGFLLDWAGARADLARALDLQPSDAAATAQYGLLLVTLGDLPSAIDVLQRATEIDPLEARAWTILGLAHVSRGDHESARAALGRATEISPRMDLARYYLFADLVAAKRPKEALAVAEQAALLWIKLTGVSMAQHDLGRAAESKAALDALVAGNAADAAYQIAEVHAWRGERELAFDWLERAHRQADTGLGWVMTDPLLRSLHDDPRWKPFLRSLNLP